MDSRGDNEKGQTMNIMLSNGKVIPMEMHAVAKDQAPYETR